mgnify:CR=1 FL=1
MNVLFLDHDGVICLAPQWGKRNTKKSKQKGEFFDPFCPKAIRVLNEIILITNCEIVISSDWRLYRNLDYMQKMYLDRGIVKAPIDYTNIFDINDEDILEETWEYKDKHQILARVREKEIMEWVLKNNPKNWVAVDDLNMKKLSNFIHVPLKYEGIKQTGIAKKIINKLNGV